MDYAKLIRIKIKLVLNFNKYKIKQNQIK